MQYKRYDGISPQEFYDVNEEEIEKHIKNNYKWKEFQHTYRNMYNDIIEWD